MLKFRAVPEDEKMWPEFFAQQEGLTKIPNAYINDASLPLPEFTGTDYLTDVNLLAGYLTSVGLKKITGRYRSYKSRTKYDSRSLNITNATLTRLKKYAADNNFYYDSMDQLIEFLIDPEERLENSKGIISPPSSLDVIESFKITRSKLSLRPHTWSVILNYLDFTYRAGWLACKHLSGAKRTDKALDDHAKQYITDINLNT